MKQYMAFVVFVLSVVATFALLKSCNQGAVPEAKACQGAQKRVEDTFKVMDACQKLIGCTITVDDLRKAQEQLNQAESCK